MTLALRSKTPDLLYTRRLEQASAIEELTRVALDRPVAVEGGHVLPPGLVGTVVAVLGGGEAFDVEFTGAVPALVTLPREAIRPE